ERSLMVSSPQWKVQGERGFRAATASAAFRAILLRLRLLQPNQQVVLHPFGPEVDENGGFILGQVIETGFGDHVLALADAEGDALRLLVDLALDGLRLVRGAVVECAADDAVLADG